MDKAYGAGYGELYRQHWWWRAREAFLLRNLRRLELVGSPPAILDVGCGDGLFFPRLSELGKVWGVEPDTELVSPDGPWADRIHIGPFDASYTPGRRFSLILMLDVLEHIADAEAALARAVSLLEQQGTLLITVPAFRALWTRHDELNQHVTRYDSRSFRHLAARAGMNIRSMRYFFHWLFPVKLAVRGLERLNHRVPRPPRVPPRWVNRSLFGVTRVEQAVTRNLPLPFGSSLLVIGGGA